MERIRMLPQVSREYRKIEAKWRKVHLNTACLLTLIAVIAEIGLFFVIKKQGLITCSIPQYVLKYILLPALCNLCACLMGFLACYRLKISHLAKNYVVSLSLVVISFVLSVVHGVFLSIYSVFLVAVIMTTIYGSRGLTTVIAALCAVTLTLSAFCIHWNLNKGYSDTYVVDIMVSLVILAGVYTSSMVIICFERAKQQAAVQSDLERRRLHRRLLLDPLTGIYSRAALQEAFFIMEQNAGGEAPIYFVMVDLDDFKQINDRQGHLCGDKVLCALGEIFRRQCEEKGCCAAFRYGGDEFCLLSRGVALQEVKEIIHRVQRDFFTLSLTGLEENCLTLSAGITRYTPGITLEELIAQADQAMYRSKGQKNSIHVYGE